ncbi:MAG: SurA N-terminal domain-containing protein [Candidatus Glassbacteria bacterium]
MMQTFRNNMKIVFYVLIFFFVGWMGVTLTGLDDFLMEQNRKDMAGLKYAGSVDGKKIERTLYEQRVQNSVDMATNRRTGASLSSWEIDQIADQVWNNLVNDIILGRVYARRNIKVRDSEVVEYIKGNPLPELRSAPELQTDGRFDYDKYHNLLSNPQAGSLVLELERDAREKIPNLKLLVEIASLSKLTDAQLEQVYREMNEQVSVNYIRFAIDSLVADSEVSVSDEEVEKYYQNHLEDFKRPERAEMEYVLIPLTPGSQDTLAARDTLAFLLEKLNGGANWDTLAMTYSHGPLASSGGNLGWFAKGDYTDQAMVDLAFSLRPGQTSQPTLTAAGYQIVRVDSVRIQDGKQEVKARRILRNISPGVKRTREVRQQARAVRKLMEPGEAAFRQVAADSGLAVNTTGEFAIGSSIPGIEISREFLDFIYGARTGSLSYPINVYQQGETLTESVILALVTQRKEAGTIPLDEAGATVRRILLIQKKKDKAPDRIRQIMAGYEAAENLEQFARNKNLVLQTSEKFSRLAGLPGVGRDNAFIGTAFGLPVGKKSGLIEVEDNYYLLETVSRTEVDLDRLKNSRSQLLQQLVNQKMQVFFAMFSAELIRKSEIEDLRKVTPSDSLRRQAMAR